MKKKAQSYYYEIKRGVGEFTVLVKLGEKKVDIKVGMGDFQDEWKRIKELENYYRDTIIPILESSHEEELYFIYQDSGTHAEMEKQLKYYINNFKPIIEQKYWNERDRLKAIAILNDIVLI
jgi:hypothetical protein